MYDCYWDPMKNDTSVISNNYLFIWYAEKNIQFKIQALAKVLYATDNKPASMVIESAIGSTATILFSYSRSHVIQTALSSVQSYTTSKKLDWWIHLNVPKIINTVTIFIGSQPFTNDMQCWELFISWLGQSAKCSPQVIRSYVPDSLPHGK